MFGFSSGTTKPSLLVTEGDSWCGFYLANALLKSHRSNLSKVIMAVRDRNNEFTRELEQMGAEIREYDPVKMDKNQLKRELFKGDVDGMVLIPIHDVRNMVKASESMIQAAEMEERCRCLLMWSTLGVQCTAGNTRGGSSATGSENWRKMFQCFQEVEGCVRQSKLEHEVIIRLNFVTQQFFGLAQVIQNRGMFPLPSGSAKFAPVNAQDVAECTAQMISSPDMMKRYNKQMLTFTGPKLYSGQEMAKIMNSTLNAKIEFQTVSMNDMEKILESNDTLDEFDVNLTLAYMELLKEDKLDIVTQDLQKVLGKSPTDIDTFFKDNANSFRPRNNTNNNNSDPFLAEFRRT